MICLFSLTAAGEKGEPDNGCARGESLPPRLKMGDRLHLPAVASTLLPVALGILTLLPHSLLGGPAESSPLLQRVKRGWVWNQFFVLEEYTGMEPLYIGKVSHMWVQPEEAGSVQVS